MPNSRIPSLFFQPRSSYPTRCIAYPRFAPHLEVERKFVPTAAFLQNIATKVASSGSESTSTVQRTWRVEQPTQIRDRYYDLNDRLFRSGIWLRNRCVESANGDNHCRWNCKFRIGGDFIHSEFIENEGEEKVRRLLSEYTPGTTLEDLELTADLETSRSAWTVCAYQHFMDYLTAQSVIENYLSIVLDRVIVAETSDGSKKDRTSFEHEVGEVELTRQIGMDTNLEVEGRGLILERMGAEIRQFMGEHPQLFSQIRPVGKLEAYFDWKKLQ